MNGASNEIHWVWQSSKSGLSNVALSKLLSTEERESFMACWSIPLCSCGQVHFLDHDWFAGLCMGIFVYKYSFNLVLLQELYWITACFIFVCKLDSSWDPWASECYCCYSTSPPPPLHEGNGLCRGMSFFKPGWLCMSNLDNAWGVFACFKCRWLSDVVWWWLCQWSCSTVYGLWHWCIEFLVST